ncbi:hypothetical protein [Flavobacterium sp. Root420]|jgi:hypothetical protein|nr:hypothetical protein [Flavobacterium sp. Root420]
MKNEVKIHEVDPSLNNRRIPKEALAMPAATQTVYVWRRRYHAGRL